MKPYPDTTLQRVDDDDRLLTTAQVAEILACKPNTLAKARVYSPKHTIPHVKIGRTVRYAMRDVRAFIRSRTATSTAQHPYL